MKRSYYISILVLFALLTVQFTAMAQGAHTGTDEGLSTPVDGGLLMGLLAMGGVAFGLLKKKNKS